MTRTWILLAACMLSACGGDDDDAPPPVHPAQPPAPIAPTPVAPIPPVAPPVPVAPTPPPSSPPRLTGAFELTWMQREAGGPIQPMPDYLISQLPGCIWARWTWVFGPNGELRVSNEMMCSAADLGAGHGMCRAEADTRVQWRGEGFHLPVPVRSSSRFVHYRDTRDPSSFDTATIRCSVSLGAIDATLTQLVPGPEATRPAEVTLVMTDGSQMHLRAAEREEVNHADVIIQNRRR
ncbi:MAG: hypothetical protein IT378_05735 [Sandaracinaceae bacterium]|nr:hypothetical protein [Sandaracinaceae bacterium]